MNTVSIRRLALAAAALIGSSALALADDLPGDGRWLGRVADVEQASDAVFAHEHASPVLTTSSLPPRRPKNLAQAAPRVVSPAAPVAQSAGPRGQVVRVAAFSQAPRPTPLFWMTIGNGF